MATLDNLPEFVIDTHLDWVTCDCRTVVVLTARHGSDICPGCGRFVA